MLSEVEHPNGSDEDYIFVTGRKGCSESHVVLCECE